MKYFAISIKMKLSLEGGDPEKHDIALKAVYVTLLVLNVLSPLVESTFVTLGDDKKQNSWVVWRTAT